MLTTKTEELKERASDHIVLQFQVVGKAPKLVWERGKGAKLWDVDGKEYLDLSSGAFQCLHLGWGRQELIDAAHEELQKIGFMPNGLNFICEMAIDYAKELAEVLPGDINHVYFNSTGTEANETAMKLTKLYWNLQGKATKYKVLCLSDSYHGGSHFAASITGSPATRNPFGAEYHGIVRIPFYHCYRCPFGLEYPSCNILCAKMVERTIEQEGEDSIACMIAEPIQGVGGFLWPPDEYWPMVSQILKDHNILLINDEVQNGFCRTGKFWGADNWNIVPDMITIGKGINSNYIPLAGVGISDKVYKQLLGCMLQYGGTSSGHPVALATGRAALKIYRDEKLAERSAKLGEHIHERLVKEFLPLPCVDNPMGRGCYQSFAIALNKTTGSKFSQEAQDKAGQEIFTRLLEKGVLARLEWNRRLAVIPPLIIGEDELDAALDVMLSIMKEVKPV